MKSKMLIATLLGCLVWQQGVLSQTDTTATDTNQTVSASAANPPAPPAVATNESPSVVTTNETAAATTATPPPAPAVATNESPSAATPPPVPAPVVTETTTTTPPAVPAATTNESPAAATPPPAPAPAVTETPAAPTPPPAPAATVTETTTTTPPPAPAPVVTETPAAPTPPPAPAATVTETTTTPPPAPAPVVTETPAVPTPPPAPAATVTETTTTPPPAPAPVVTETPAAPTPPPVPAATTNESPAVATPPAAPAPAVTETPAVPTPPPAPAPVVTETTTTATPPAAPAATVTETTTTTTAPPPAPAATTNESTSAATSNETAVAGATTPPAAPAATTNVSPSAATSNAQASAPASIPLIQFQDVPITTAIENLTRQAGINYLLDPKIGYGQPDQNGQVKPEPTLSIRWENITAAQALSALLDNYGLQIVEDRRTHISRITTKDPTAPPQLSTRVVQVKYAGTSNLVEAIQASFTDKRSKVLPDARTSQLVVVATENEQEAVESLISQLDKPTRQVLIETKLVEISSNPTTTKGVDWSGTLAAQHVSFGNGYLSDANTTVNTPGKPVTTTTGGTTTPGYTTTVETPGDSTHLPTITTTTVGPTTTGGTSTTKTPLFDKLTDFAVSGGSGLSYNTLSGLTPAIGFLSADGASAVLHFLNANYDAQIISTPRVVTLDNQMATIEVTRGYPVISMSGGTQNSSGSASVTYSNVGTILQVTPRISANNYIWLRVIPVVSSHFGDEIITVQGGAGNPSTSYGVPIFDNRRIDSQVMIPDGNTLVMGGLIQDNPTASYTKVPLLGDIPGLGWAFRSEGKSMTKDNLIIFMTPTIIKESDFQPATSAPADYLQSKPALMKSRINPHSIWDGAQPRGDWSNPAPIPGEFDKK